jgi:serine/threonine protein kinase
MATDARPLLPGVLLRGGRYRLRELQERQDWLSGVFEAVWIGNDAHRAGSQVMITEVVLPENTSVMTQTILRTATMALVTVGRHPHIPGLWDAFSDQGRSFFVFEPIEGETLMGRMRYSGRTLPEQEVIECCLQLTDVLEFLSQQSPQLVHGLIRPEHIVLSRNNSQYILTNFSVVLAGGGTQFIAGMERSHLSAYTAPEFIRGVADVRTDMYSLIATAYHAVTGSAPAGISGSIPQAQRINPNVSSAFDAILSKGLRTVPNQRYQRPSELRQDLLAMRSVSSTLVSGRAGNPVFQSSNPTFVSKTGQQTHAPTQQSTDQVAQALPLILNTNYDMEEPVLLLPKPEDLPPMQAGNDTMNATILLGLILVVLIVVVVMSQMTL